MTGPIAARLAALGLDLPAPFPPAGTYVGHRRLGALLYVAGMGPTRGPGEIAVTGRIGRERTIEDAIEAARLTALNLVAELARAGALERVVRVVKLFGLVNAGPDFTAVGRVLDGASDLLVELFGEAGRHARTSIVSPALPSRITVEIDAIFALS